MNLHWIDWCIVGGLLAAFVVIGVAANRLTKGVAGFLAADRSAGKYLLTMAQGMAGLGAITIVAQFEKYYKAGFAALWWETILMPVMMITALTGWVAYRFRETRALTMAQFFEMRYSRRFRIFAGALAWFSGIINYGIFPIVTARLIVYFFGFPDSVELAGLSLPVIPLIMAVMLGSALIVTLSGGQIAIMITDFLQGALTLGTFSIITALLFYRMDFNDMMLVLGMREEGTSVINPFDQAKIEDFNVWFFLIVGFNQVYNFMAWQGPQGYYAAAKSPHAAKMARILAEWRTSIVQLLMVFLPVCALYVSLAPQWEAFMEPVNAAIAAIEDPQVQNQMRVPLVLANFLPVGLFGLFCVAIIASAFSTDNTCLHSWGSIFVQDVLLPLRGRPFSTRNHLLILRCSIIGVAVFAFTYSSLFPLEEYIWMYQLITGAIFLGGAGSVIIGGLYTRFGTTAGAWAGMLSGSVFAVSGLALRLAWPRSEWLQQIAPKFPLNGAAVLFCAALIAVTSYLVTSLLTSRQPFDLDAMLHRDSAKSSKDNHRSIWQRLGLTDEFSRFDKFIFFFKIGWTVFWVGAFVLGTTAYFLGVLPLRFWPLWWQFKLWVMLIFGIGTVIWFTWGGISDIRDLVHTLGKFHEDDSDDGTVKNSSAPGGSR
jgi:solute:Na+ symporter, SSS family